MIHAHHAGNRVIGPDTYSTIRRGFILLRDRDDVLVEWDDRSNTWFHEDEVLALCKEENPEQESE